MISKPFSDKSGISPSFFRFSLATASNLIPQMYCIKYSYNVIMHLVEAENLIKR